MKPEAPVTSTLTGGSASQTDALPERAPDVDDVAAAEDEGAVRPMGGREDDDVAVDHDAIKWHEPLVDHIRIRAQHGGAGPLQELSELEAQRGPDVVRFGLEGHSQDSDGPTVEAAVPADHGRDDVCREALVDLHRRLAHGKVVGRERR